MRMKRFEAPTMTEALRRIREEFGSDAVILSARSLRRFPSALGFGRTSRVEVTAAVDVAWPPSSALPAGAATEASCRGRLPAWSSRLRALAGRKAALASSPAVSDRPGFGEDFRRGLIAAGVEPETAGAWVERLAQAAVGDPQGHLARLKEAAASVLKDLGIAEFPVSDACPRRSAFVGGPGAGKTTLAAKLAAREVMRQGRRVALLSLDDRRICGADELRSCAAALRVPFAAARSVEEAASALQGWLHLDWVLIDTAGAGPAEKTRREETLGRLSALGCREIHLVVPAGLRDAADAWRRSPPAA